MSVAYGRISPWATARVLVQLAWARTFSVTLVAAVSGLLLLPVLFALAFASRGSLTGDPVAFLVQRYDTLVCGLAMPLIGLLLGTSAFSAEIEDGTLLYLVTTTTPRWWIVCVRVMYASTMTGLLSAFAVWSTGAIATAGSNPEHVTTAFTVAVLFGGTIYAALFTALALLTRRALVAGLVYVLFWEGALSRIFPALHYLSVRQWTLAVASSLTESSDQALQDGPSLAASLIGAALLVVLSVYIGGRQLQRPRVQR
jgi:ABC-2 type transport system permease protein